MFHWLTRRSQRRIERAVEQGRGAIESVLGLPHVLAHPLVERHFGDTATPSNEEFRETGRNGYWVLPSPHADIRIRVAAGGDGRLTEGAVSGQGPLQGLHVYTLWSPDVASPVWQIRLTPPLGERAAELYEALAGEPPPPVE